MLFYILILFVIIQRITELSVSKRNEKWLLSQGAVEYGKEHYRFIVIMHAMFFVSMIAEYNFKSVHNDLNIINYLFLVFFALLQIMRFWVIHSLGKFWNTRIIRVPGSDLVKSGPYKFLKHPNYVIVALEIFCLPMIFGLYYTAIIFTILNSLILYIRIKEENKVLIN